MRDPIMTKPVLYQGLMAERVHLGKDGERVFYGSDHIGSPDETSNSVMVVPLRKVGQAAGCKITSRCRRRMKKTTNYF